MSSNKTQILLKRIKEDRPWYMENFLKIRNKEAKLIPFKINDAQELFEEEIRKCEREGILKRFIVLKARQWALVRIQKVLYSTILLLILLKTQ